MGGSRAVSQKETGKSSRSVRPDGKSPRSKYTPRTKHSNMKSETKKTEESRSSSSDSEKEKKDGKPHKKKVEMNHEERKAHKKMTAADRPKLDSGDIVVGMKYKFEVISLLGSGGFGDVYKVKPSDCPDCPCSKAAMKTELLDENNNPMMNRLKVELEIFKQMGKVPEEKKSHFTDMYDRGITPAFKFIVMELVGESVYGIQKVVPKREFGLATALKLGMQTLEALDNLHEMGYIHRDIKPQNYSIGLEKKKNTVFMLDFGIARRYVKKPGSKVLRVPREKVKFLGTLKYASRCCHHNKEQGRKDDLEAWMYMQLEFIDFPTLYWAPFRDRVAVLEAKEKLFKFENQSKLENIPPEVQRVMAYLDGLNYESAPDYEFIRALLTQCAKTNEVSLSDPFDWEEGGKRGKRYKRKKFLGIFAVKEENNPKKKDNKEKESKDKDTDKNDSTKE